MQDSLSLKELIRRVTQELIASQREREVSGEPALFEVEGLTLEVHFVVTKAKNVKGGFEFKVLTLGGIDFGGGGERQEQQVHKIVLSLKAASRAMDRKSPKSKKLQSLARHRKGFYPIGPPDGG